MRLQAQPTRFYKTLEEQNRFKAQCLTDCIIAPIVPCNFLPYFVIERGDTEYFDIVRFESKCIDGGDVESLSTARFSACTFDGIDYIVHDAEFKDPCINCGLHYFEVEDSDGNIWYSDLFEVKDFEFGDDDYYYVSWKNSKPINKVEYSASNRFYYWFAADANIGVPEYRKQIETVEDGFGKEKRTFELLEKFYLVDTGNIPEFIVDAIEFASMNDDLTLTIPNQETVVIDKLETSVEWNDDGCYANTTIRFIIESCIIDDGCGDIKDGCIDEIAEDVLQGLDASTQTGVELSLPADGDRYLITTDDFASGNSWAANVGSVATWNASLNDWDFQEQVEGSYFHATIPNFYFLITGGIGLRVFVINSASDAGLGIADIVGEIPPNTWCRVLYSSGGGYSAWSTIFTSAQISAGVQIGALLTPATYTFRLDVFNHNCSYPDQRIPSQSQSVNMA